MWPNHHNAKTSPGTYLQLIDIISIQHTSVDDRQIYIYILILLICIAYLNTWQHICYVQMTCFSTDCRHSNGNQLCPLLADSFFFYFDEADFIQELLRKKDKKLAISFNFTFRYIDDFPSLNTQYIELEIQHIKLSRPHILTYI